MWKSSGCDMAPGAWKRKKDAQTSCFFVVVVVVVVVVFFCFLVVNVLLYCKTKKEEPVYCFKLN